MAEHNNLQEATSAGRPDNAWTFGPKDFIFKYLHYIPWLLVSMAVFGVMAYIKNRYATPIYRMQGTMLINNDRMSQGRGDEKFDEMFMSGGVSNLSNEIQILRSRPLLERVAGDLDLQTSYYGEGNIKTSMLYPVYPFKLDIIYIADSSNSFGCKVTFLDDKRFLVDESKKPVAFGEAFMIGTSKCRLLPDSSVDPRTIRGNKFHVSWQPIQDVAENLIGGLRVVQANDQSTILTLTFEGENARLGKDVLNTLMSVYDTTIVEDKKKIQENTLRFINTQLLQLSDTLSGVQGGLSNFMVQNQVYDIDNQSKSFIDGLGENAKQKDLGELKLNIINWLLEYVGNKKNIFELVPTPLGIEEPALLQLVTEYNKMQLEREANLKTTTAGNPLIVNLEGSLERVRKDIYQALLNVKQSYVIAGADITRHQQELQSQVTSLPGKSMRMLNIQRRQKILEELYSLLLQKKLETQIASASTISNSKMLEPSIGGGDMISPDRKKVYMLYLMLGLFIPIGIIAVKEVLQDKVNGRSDVEKHTRAPILGEIGHSDTKQSLVVTLNSRRLIAEQFRIVRTNLQYMIAKKEKPVIMITSTFSGEGKSFISTNMGAVMALSGKKTVIMEFDIRKPKIISGLDLKRKMGITNYIIGKARFEDLLVKVENVDGLYVIPCGPIPPNPAELLLDKRLDELMEEVFNHFECIIMDTAPIGLVSDATNLGRFADCTLYIVRQKQTFRKQLAFIEDMYNSKKLPSLCLLINDVKPEGGYYGGYYGSAYGYYSGYGYGAKSGYFEDDSHKKREKEGGFFRFFKKKK